MRRREREVCDRKEIYDILTRCNTIRIAMQGDEFPYVVPVSFGVEIVDDKPIIYFHCARQGMKLELLQSNKNVCVEGDIFINVEKTNHGITTRYESIIGFGKCTFVTEPDEIIHGMKLLTEHYGYYDYPLERCAGLQHLRVVKIILDDITGKKNLPGSMTPADNMHR